MGGQAAYRLESETSAPPTRSFEDRQAGVFGTAGSVVNFSQDREIYAEGDAAISFYKIISGVVRTCKFLSDGRRQIDAFYRAGDIFGIEDDGTHKLNAEAVSDCTLISYRRRGLDASTSGLSDSTSLFDHLVRRLTQSQEHALLLGRRSALERVATFLVDWADQSKDRQTVSLAMTRQDMADFLGLTIETVSRTLAHLQRKSLIAMPSARHIHLSDLEALRELKA